MAPRNCQCAAFCFLKSLCLILLVSSGSQLSAEAFTAASLSSGSGRTTLSWLFGTRSRRKRDIFRESLQYVIPGLTLNQKNSHPTAILEPTERDITSTFRDIPVQQRTNDETIPSSVADTLKRRKVSLYKPPEKAKSRHLNELEEEFRNMLLHFSNYTQADVLSIVDPKMRFLFEGIAASAHSEPVYRAFEILFEDLLPLRLAGRVLFRKLRKFMNRSVAAQAEDIAIISQRTGLSNQFEREKLEELRLLFLTTASKLNKSNRLTADQLRETGILSDVATRVLSFESTEELIAHIDLEGTGKLGFVELITGLWDCVTEVCGVGQCDPQKLLFEVLLDLNRSMPAADIDLGESTKDQQNRRRYDDMVTAFIEWKEYLPEKQKGETEGRRMEIVRGCFVGAEIPEVVNALRIVYMDYRPLRFAGDVIFSLVSNRMKSQKAST